MQWLEIYLLSERLMNEVAERNKSNMTDSFYDILDSISSELNIQDKEYLRGRRGIESARSLNFVKPPAHIYMEWVPRESDFFLVAEIPGPRNEPITPKAPEKYSPNNQARTSEEIINRELEIA